MESCRCSSLSVDERHSLMSDEIEDGGLSENEPPSDIRSSTEENDSRILNARSSIGGRGSIFR